MSWNGEERRKKSNDHDTLIEVVQILRSHVEHFDNHVSDDKENFNRLNRTMWVSVGGVGTILFLIKLVVH